MTPAEARQRAFEVSWDAFNHASRATVREDWKDAIAAYERAMAEEGWRMVRGVQVGEPAAWPSACKHPNSCARHRECMYLGCEHQGFDIGPEVDATLTTRQGDAP